MSRDLINAAQRLPHTVFKTGLGKYGTEIEVINAAVIWPDFSGKEKEFVQNGRKIKVPAGSRRSFNLVVNEETANVLEQLGVVRGKGLKERPVDPTDESAGSIWFVNVKVRMEPELARPAEVELVVGDVNPDGTINVSSMNPLNLTTVGTVDMSFSRGEVVNFDCLINVSRPQDPTKSASIYLKKAYVTIQPVVEFDGRYIVDPNDEATIDDIENGDLPR